MVTLVLGGTRSGKSEIAERLGREAAGDGPLTYVATGSPGDADMADRIERHRRRRPTTWETLEVSDAPTLAAQLAGLSGVVLLDSLGAWVAAHRDFDVDLDALTAGLRHRRDPTVVVSEEVGLSVHPTTTLGRRFVDAVGAANQAVSAVADRAVLVVAGRLIEL